MDEPARKYFELGPQICQNSRRKENRRRALRIGPLRRSQDGGLDHAPADVLNYPFLITYLGLLALWVVVICLILV